MYGHKHKIDVPALRTHAMKHLRYRESDGHFIWKTGAHKGKRAGGINYAKGDRRAAYRKINFGGGWGRHAEHRLAYLFKTGDFPANQIDHENHDGTDNSWDNIRPATQCQNQWNKRVPADHPTGVPGIRIDKAGKFIVDQQTNGERFFKRCGFDLELAKRTVAERQAAHRIW